MVTLTVHKLGEIHITTPAWYHFKNWDIVLVLINKNNNESYLLCTCSQVSNMSHNCVMSQLRMLDMTCKSLKLTFSDLIKCSNFKKNKFLKNQKQLKKTIIKCGVFEIFVLSEVIYVKSGS